MQPSSTGLIHPRFGQERQPHQQEQTVRPSQRSRSGQPSRQSPGKQVQQQQEQQQLQQEQEHRQRTSQSLGQHHQQAPHLPTLPWQEEQRSQPACWQSPPQPWLPPPSQPPQGRGRR